jgi:drug/metabolite transporter (DMT)-like permease
MATIALALGAACGWGLADFLAGRASRAASALRVLCVTEAVGLAISVPVAIIAGGGPTALQYVLFAAASGVTLSVALGALYRGMVVGKIGIVSPIAAGGTVIPILVGLLQGDRPSPIQAGGVCLAVCGVILASWSGASAHPGAEVAAGRTRITRVGRPRLSSSVRWGLLSALGGGFTSVAIQQSARGGVVWFLIVQRATVVSLAALMAARFRVRLTVPVSLWPMLLAAGACDLAGTGLYAASSRHGELALAAAVSSLYPVLTVGLALTVLGERLTTRQLTGVMLAMAGTVAIAAAS